MTMPSRNILFADDDVLTQWTMTEVLLQAGFTVTNACRGIEAVALLDGSEEFDLLLTDVDLPDNVNGHELADRWRQTLPGRPVIYTGVKRGPTFRLLDHHEHFQEKPFSEAKLLRLVEWALEDASFRPFMPSITRRGHHIH